MRTLELSADSTNRSYEPTLVDSQDAILADEARWDAQFAASKDKLRCLAATARAEIRAGNSYEMVFTDDGKIVRGS